LIVRMYAHKKILFKKLPIFCNNVRSWTQKKIQRINKTITTFSNKTCCPIF
jgi:hypothetical protein